MEYNVNDLDKIMSFTSWNNKKKIDELLRIDCTMYTNLGIDSTEKEKSTVKSCSRKIYNHIKKLDHRMGTEFLLAMDKR
jgi:hypothetical protein